jgi:hypothetical protein
MSEGEEEPIGELNSAPSGRWTERLGESGRGGGAMPIPNMPVCGWMQIFFIRNRNVPAVIVDLIVPLARGSPDYCRCSPNALCRRNDALRHVETGWTDRDRHKAGTLSTAIWGSSGDSPVTSAKVIL